MTQPTEPDAALAKTAASVVAGLVIAVEHVDHPEIARLVAQLLNAVVQHNAALRARPSDAPLLAAVARLSVANDR